MHFAGLLVQSDIGLLVADCSHYLATPLHFPGLDSSSILLVQIRSHPKNNGQSASLSPPIPRCDREPKALSNLRLSWECLRSSTLSGLFTLIPIIFLRSNKRPYECSHTRWDADTDGDLIWHWQAIGRSCRRCRSRTRGCCGRRAAATCILACRWAHGSSARSKGCWRLHLVDYGKRILTIDQTVAVGDTAVGPSVGGRITELLWQTTEVTIVIA